MVPDMGVIAKAGYKEFLKSDFWMAMRNKIIGLSEGVCSICCHQSHDNHVHHVFYKSDWYSTKPHHLRVLCDSCHELVHLRMKELPTPAKISGHYKLFTSIKKSIIGSSQEIQRRRLDVRLSRLADRSFQKSEDLGPYIDPEMKRCLDRVRRRRLEKIYAKVKRLLLLSTPDDLIERLESAVNDLSTEVEDRSD